MILFLKALFWHLKDQIYILRLFVLLLDQEFVDKAPYFMLVNLFFIYLSIDRQTDTYRPQIDFCTLQT